MITENLSTLKIHKLTQEQYDRELAAGNIDASALYLTPDEDDVVYFEDYNSEIVTAGKVKTLYSDKEKTEALFPRTKTSAVSDENGKGLNALLNDINSKIDNCAATLAEVKAYLGI